MTAEGFLGQLFVSVGVDTSGLANAATEFTRFQQKVMTTTKMTQAATAQAANISDARLKQSFNAEAGYIKDKINAAKQWEAHQAKWRTVEENYYKQQEVTRNKALSSYNAARKLGNSQESQYYRQQAQEAAAAEKAVARANQGIGMSFNSLSNNLYRFGTFATMAFTLPLAALATLGVKSAMELEQIKQKTVALANVSQEQMDAWSGAITRIGIATNATSKAIAQALYFVTSAGVDNASAMKMVEYAAKGSAAGLGETDVIAKLLTYTYNAYGKEAFNAAKRMDELTVAVREGAAEATDFAVVMGDLIPIAAQIGVTFADLGGMLAGMTQIGLNAHKSATALRQVMMEMIRPSKQAAKALDEAAKKMGDMSIASINLTKTVETEGLFPVLQKLKTVSETMGPLFLPTVFDNVRSFNGLMAMIGPNMDKVQEIIRKTKTEVGAFENALSIMTQTSEFKLGQFKKAWELATIDLGKSILPTLLPWLHSLSQTINDLSSWFKSLSSSMQSVVLGLGAFLAILGPLTIALSGMVRLWAILGMSWTGMIIPAIHAVGTALVWLSNVMLANPYLMMAAAVAALAYIIYDLVTAKKQLTLAEQTLVDVREKATQGLIEEKNVIDSLLGVINNSNSSEEQRLAAIKRLNLISPEYLGAITAETAATNKAKDAVDRYLTSLERKGTMQAIIEEENALEKKRVSALATGSDAKLSFGQEVGDFFTKALALDAFGLAVDRTAVKTRNVQHATYEYNMAILALHRAMNDLNNNAIYQEEQRLTALATAISEGKKKIQDLFIVYRNAIDADVEKPKKEIEGIIETFEAGLVKIRAMKAMYGKEIDYSGLKFNEQEELLKTYGSVIESLAGKMDKSTPYYTKLRKEFEALAVAQRAAAMNLSYMNPDETTTNIPTGDKAKLAIRGGGVQMTNTSVYTARIAETTAKYTLAAREAIITSKALGSAFNLNSELIKINDNLIKDLATIYVSASGQVSAMAFAQDALNVAMQKNIFLSVKDVMDQYSAAMAKNQKQYELSGNGHRKYIADIQAELEKRQKLLELIPRTTEEYKKEEKAIKKLQDTLSGITGWQKFNETAQKVGQQMNSMISSYTELIKQKQTASYEMIDAIAKKEGRSAEWIAKKKAALDAEYGRKFKQMAIAQAVINGALAVQAIWAHFTDPISAAIETAFVVAATIANVAVISGQKMAKGGIVPSGYNNDTYPALLSSGETVIPASPHKLSSLAIGAGNQTINLSGKLVAEGDDLVYVFNKKVKLMQSY